MSEPLKVQIEMTRAMTPEALKDWVLQYPEKARRLRDGLLADALFARVHFLQTMATDKLSLIKALSQNLPTSSVIKETLSLLEADNFHTRILGWDPEVSDQEAYITSLLQMAQDYLYRVSHLPRINKSYNYNSIHSSMNFISGESEEEWSPDVLPMYFHFQMLHPKPKRQALEKLIQDADQAGMPALSTMSRFELAHLLSEQTEGKALLKQELTQTEKLNHSVLTGRIKAIQEPKLAAQFLQDLIVTLPEGDAKLYLQKLQSDHLLLLGQTKTALEQYQELFQTNVPWLQTWILKTYAQIEDSGQIPELISLLKHPNEQIVIAAVKALQILMQPKTFKDNVSELLATLNPHQQANIIYAITYPTELPEQLLMDALTAPDIELQLAVLTHLQSYPSRRRLTTPPPFVREVKALLHSRSPLVQKKALDYLRIQNQYDPAMIKILKQHPDLQSMRIYILGSLAEQIPADEILQWQQDADPETQLEALYILVLRGKRHQIKDFLTLWQDKRFLEHEVLARHLGMAMEKGDISWQSWRQAIETSNPIPDGLISALEHAFSPFKPIPEQSCQQLESLLAHSDSRLRSEAVKHLQRCPRTPALSQKIGALSKDMSHPSLRLAVLDYLANESDPQWNDLFIDAQQDKDEEIREIARRYLIRQQPDLALMALAHAKQMSSKELRHLVSLLFSADLPPEQKHQLKQKVRNLLLNTDKHLREELLWQLVREQPLALESDIVNELLLQPEVSYALIKLVSERPVLLEVSTLRELLKHQDPDIQAAALVLAGIKSDRSVIAEILPLIKRNDLLTAEQFQIFRFSYHPPRKSFPLRELALFTLINLDSSTVTTHATVFLDDLNPELRKKALAFLKHKKHSVFTPDQIDHWLQHTDPAIRLFALGLQEQSKSATTSEEVLFPPEVWLPFLLEADADIRMTALNKLERYPSLDPKLIEPLINDPAHHIREQTQNQLTKLKIENQGLTTELLLKQLEDNPGLIFQYKSEGLPNHINWDEVYQGLLQRLRAQSQQNRYLSDMLTQTLIEIKGRESLPDVLELLKTHFISSSLFRNYLQPEHIPQLAALLKESKYPYQQYFAIEALDELKAVQCQDLILRQLNHKNNDLQRVAIRFLGRHGNRQAILALFSELEANHNPDEIYQILSQHPLPEVFPRVLSLMKHPNQELARYGLRLVGDWHIKEALPYLLKQLETSSPQDRLNPILINALGNLGDSTALPALQKQLQRQPHSLILIQALYSLGDAQTARPALQAYLKQATSDGRIDGLAMLKDLKDKEMLPYVLTLLPSRESGTLMWHGVMQVDSREVGSMATDILSELADPQAVSELIKLLPQLDKDQQEDLGYIIESIAERHPIWPEETIQQLEALTHSQDSLISTAAKIWHQQMKP